MKLAGNGRWPARIAVLALHAGLFALLWQHRPPRLPEARERSMVTLRLLPPPKGRSTEPAPPQRPPPAPRQPRLELPTAPPAAADRPTPTAEPAAPTAPSIAPPAPTEPPRTTLRLSLPPGYAASANAARNPALSDPRSNTARSTRLEDRVADATGGSSTWAEEPVENHAQAIGAQGDRRTVLRKGDTCVEVFRSRIADSDAFNNSVAPRTVPMVGRPYTCKNTKSER